MMKAMMTRGVCEPGEGGKFAAVQGLWGVHGMDFVHKIRQRETRGRERAYQVDCTLFSVPDEELVVAAAVAVAGEEDVRAVAADLDGERRTRSSIDMRCIL